MSAVQKICVLLGAFICSSSQGVKPVQDIRICVYQPTAKADNVKFCTETFYGLDNVGVNATCTGSSYSIGCLIKIMEGEADVMTADPEDLYVAHKLFPGKLRIFGFFSADWESDAVLGGENIVAVIRNNSEIRSMSDLRGKRACVISKDILGTAKIVLKKLVDERALQKRCRLSHTSYNTKQSEEIAAFDEFFGPSCVWGQWALRDDPHRLSSITSLYNSTNACSLCDNPDLCNQFLQSITAYDSNETAMDCFLNKGGDVAMASASEIYQDLQNRFIDAFKKKHKYSLLCPDGNRWSLDYLTADDLLRNCSWGFQPNTAILTRVSLSSSETRALGTLLLFENKWSEIESVDRLGRFIEHDIVVTPSRHLEIGGYGTVFDNATVCDDALKVRVCTTEEDMLSCRFTKAAATAFEVDTDIECILADTYFDCMWMVSDGEADIVALREDMASFAQEYYNLTFVVATDQQVKHGDMLIALRKKNSSPHIHNLESIRDKRISLVYFPDRDFNWRNFEEFLDVFETHMSPPVEYPCSLNISVLRRYFSDICVYGSVVDNVNEYCSGCKNFRIGCPKATNNVSEANRQAVDSMLSGLSDIAFVYYKNYYKYYKITYNEVVHAVNASVDVLCPFEENNSSIAVNNVNEECDWMPNPLKIVVLTSEMDKTNGRFPVIQNVVHQLNLMQTTSTYPIFQPFQSLGSSDTYNVDYQVALSRLRHRYSTVTGRDMALCKIKQESSVRGKSETTATVNAGWILSRSSCCLLILILQTTFLTVLY